MRTYEFMMKRVVASHGDGVLEVEWYDTVMRPTDFQRYFRHAGTVVKRVCACPLPDGVCQPHPMVLVAWHNTRETVLSIMQRNGQDLIHAYHRGDAAPWQEHKHGNYHQLNNPIPPLNPEPLPPLPLRRSARFSDSDFSIISMPSGSEYNPIVIH